MSHTGPGPHPAGSGETSHTHSAPKQPLIAVIAIHGVGRHEPGASAQDVATLLTSLGREDNHLSIAAADKTVPLYPGFLTESLVIPLHPVITEETAQAKELHARARLAISADSGDDQVRTAANDRYQPTWFSKIWGTFDERRGFVAYERTPRFTAPLAPAQK